MAEAEGAGDRFQRLTEYQRHREPSEPSGPARRPPPYKRVKGAKTLRLDRPVPRGGAPLWETIQARRSVRRYADRPITATDLSQLLWAAQGITRGSGRDAYRAAPSAGGLYPVETYVVVHAVEGVEPGVYHYGVEKHVLEQMEAGDFRAPIKKAALGQAMTAEAAAVFVWSAVFDRSKWQYGQRANRYVYLDAGHIGQSLALAAVALGLASCPVAAFYDDQMNAIIDVDGRRESVVYLTTVGNQR